MIRLLLWVFYRRIEVVGAERIPASGGLIVAANHHNSIVDAMILLAVMPRRLSALGKAQLFDHPLIGPFLKLLGALPVHRRQEAGNDPRKNDALFEATTRTLREGGGIVIFPEGHTQPEPVLLELRTGTARMLLAAQPAAVTLLPVGLVWEKPGIFREGRALVLVGEPVPTQESVELVCTDSQGAARKLTDALTRALRELIVEAQDLETLGLLEAAESIWPAEGGARRAGIERVRWLQQASELHARLQKSAPERLAGYVTRLQAFMTELAAGGFDLRTLDQPRSVPVATRFAGRQAFALFVGAPLWLCGILVHGVPYALVGLALHLIPHTAEEEATDKMAAGLVLYPVFWCLEGWLLWHYGGGWWLAAFLLLLVPAGFVALSWRQRVARVDRGIRGYARILREPGLLGRLREERKNLQKELMALADEAGRG